MAYTVADNNYLTDVFNTDRATGAFGPTVQWGYKTVKGALPYLGAPGVAAHGTLTGFEVTAEAFLRAKDYIGGSTPESLAEDFLGTLE